MTKDNSKTVLIIGTNMMNLYNHRLELINELLHLGYKVAVATPEGREAENLVKTGCQFIPMAVDNRGTNIKRDIKLIKDLRRIYNTVKPDIILTFYTKTNIYGGLVARSMKIPYLENICGLGTSLVKENMLGKFMRLLYKNALKKASFVFFQNKDNIRFITGNKIYNGPHDLLPGSGVSLPRYPILSYPHNKNPEFLFCSRIIKEKGIDEYLEAARKIKIKYPDTIFHVAGPCDPSYEEIVKNAHEDGTIIYHGKILDLHPLLQQTHCTIHPSYYPEGMANILLESAASGRPLITTPLPGCGETVTDNVTGFVVKEKDPADLSRVIEKFILLSPEAKEKMGLEGRKKMEKEFNRDIVIHQYVEHIKEILDHHENHNNRR